MPATRRRETRIFLAFSEWIEDTTGPLVALGFLFGVFLGLTILFFLFYSDDDNDDESHANLDRQRQRRARQRASLDQRRGPRPTQGTLRA